MGRAIASVLSRGVPTGLEADYHFAEARARENGSALAFLENNQRQNLVQSEFEIFRYVVGLFTTPESTQVLDNEGLMRGAGFEPTGL